MTAAKQHAAAAAPSSTKKNAALDANETKLEDARMAVLELLTEDGHEEGELGHLTRSAKSVDELQVYVTSRSNPLTPFGSKLRNAAGIPTPPVAEQPSGSPTATYDYPQDAQPKNDVTVIGEE